MIVYAKRSHPKILAGRKYTNRDAAMKKLTILTAGSIPAVLLISLLLAGCQGGVRGSGKLTTESYNYSNFTNIDVSSAFKIDITRSGSYSVQVTVDDNLLEYVEISQEGETLEISLKTVTLLWPVTMEAKITMPELRGLVISEATRCAISGFSSTKNLDIELSGASSLDLVDISAGDVQFNVYGASEVTGDIIADDTEFYIGEASTVQLVGSTGDLVIDADGASRAKLADFTVENANVKFSGASTGTINVYGRLDADLSGASTLAYLGDPAMGTIKTSGAATLSWK